MKRKLVLTLADTEGLPAWLDQVEQWYPTTTYSSAGVNVRLCIGQREMFLWRVTDLSIPEDENTE